MSANSQLSTNLNINFCLKIKKIANPRQHKNEGKFIPKKELLKEVLSQGQGENPYLKCFFALQVKVFTRFLTIKTALFA